MTVAFGETIFDSIDFDREADVLYLSVSGVDPVHREESPEGHVLRYDSSEKLCGITVIGVSRHLDSEGQLTVTVPEALDLRDLDLVPA